MSLQPRIRPRGLASLFGDDVVFRILRDVFDINSIVEMVTSAGASRANITNYLAPNHFFAFFDARGKSQ